jgi:SAM-dependent methyltransferase
MNTPFDGTANTKDRLLKMDEYLKTNKSLWNAWAAINHKSAFYNVESFKAGESSLAPIEIEEVGDVKGKSLLHLQCHFGMDTLSWARRGARVTGVDFSEKAIELARSLSQEIQIKSNFICSDIYELPQVLDDKFDIVFTSYGVLGWLSDLNGWAEIIAQYLKPGGTFYIVEFHPVLLILDEATGTSFKYPYFPATEPLMLVEKGSYADQEVDFTADSYQWIYTLSTVINALVSAGLSIKFMHEFPYSTYSIFPFMQQESEKRWIIKNHTETLPMMFSIKATNTSDK